MKGSFLLKKKMGIDDLSSLPPTKIGLKGFSY
jgi:hypothetical protein